MVAPSEAPILTYIAQVSDRLAVIQSRLFFTETKSVNTSQKSRPRVSLGKNISSDLEPNASKHFKPLPW